MTLTHAPAREAGSAPQRLRWLALRRSLDPTAVFAHVALFTCIILQRFGLPLGSASTLSISLPVFWGLMLWMLLTRRARLAAGQGLLFLLFVSWALISAVAALVSPDPRVGFSMLSLINILMLYLPMNVRPTEDFDGRVVREVFLFYVRVCAVAGIAQFALQFVHIRLFAFGQMVPALQPFLLEKAFAWNPLIAYGSTTVRSNGFFLLEPSIFSQVLCLAILIDLFIVNRWRYLPLYAVAYMVSYSGTGLLTLALTLALVGLTSVQYSLRVVGLALLAIFVAGLTSVLLPDQFGAFAGRFGEIGSAGSSGYARYVAPLAQVSAFSDSLRMFLGYGPGASTRSIYFLTGTGNSAVQLFIDYGLIGLLLFAFFFISSVWSRRYAAVSLLIVLIFELGGGNLLFIPFIILFNVLGVWMPTKHGDGDAAGSRPLQRRYAPPRASLAAS